MTSKTLVDHLAGNEHFNLDSDLAQDSKKLIKLKRLSLGLIGFKTQKTMEELSSILIKADIVNSRADAEKVLPSLTGNVYYLGPGLLALGTTSKYLKINKVKDKELYTIWIDYGSSWLD